MSKYTCAQYFAAYSDTTQGRSQPNQHDLPLSNCTSDLSHPNPLLTLNVVKSSEHCIATTLPLLLLPSRTRSHHCHAKIRYGVYRVDVMQYWLSPPRVLSPLGHSRHPTVWFIRSISRDCLLLRELWQIHLLKIQSTTSDIVTWHDGVIYMALPYSCYIKALNQLINLFMYHTECICVWLHETHILLSSVQTYIRSIQHTAVEPKQYNDYIEWERQSYTPQ